MSQVPDKQETTTVALKSHLLLYAKGVAMGMGDSVPGISGGTIAVITHIYDKLIFSIRAVDLQAVKLLLRGQVRQLWQHINGTFLLVLALGILSGLLLSASTVLYLLDNYFEPLMAFFIGLVLASSWLLRQEFVLPRSENLIALGLGISFTVMIGMLPQADGNFSLPAMFFSGAVAICAMILPGLSGAFILLLLGVYQFVLTALLDFNLPVILVFTAGCVAGLLAFSRLLAWLLRNYHERSYAFIVGMLLGSLSVLWPWQQALSYYTNSAGELHALRATNVLPAHYAELTGQEPKLLLVVAGLLLGLVLVVGLQTLSARFTSASKTNSPHTTANREADTLP